MVYSYVFSLVAVVALFVYLISFGGCRTLFGGAAMDKLSGLVRHVSSLYRLLRMVLGGHNNEREQQGRVFQLDWWSQMKLYGSVLAAFCYTVSPIDLIPDYIPIVGLMDDAGVWVGALLIVSSVLDVFEKFEAETENLRRQVDRHKREAADAKEGSLCVVCLEREKSCLFEPCHHCVVCFECAEQQQTCPYCRADIVSRKRIYIG